MQTALVTGANDFVGRALCHALYQRGIHVNAAIPSVSTEQYVPHCKLIEVGELKGSTRWQEALEGVDTVFHLACTFQEPLNLDSKSYLTSIVSTTRALVMQAINAGVKRFIYVSTTQVYGVDSSGKPIKETDQCKPQHPYASAKLAAEQVVRDLSKDSALEWVIIRPPLVYGPQREGNFQRLARWVQRLPLLPLGKALAPRSMISVDNLVNFMIICATTPAADHQTFNITDGIDLSTAELCRIIAKNLDKKRLIVPIPVSILKLLFKLIGQKTLTDKIFGQLCYDITRAKQLINWKPVVTIETAVKSALRYVK